MVSIDAAAGATYIGDMSAQIEASNADEQVAEKTDRARTGVGGRLVASASIGCVFFGLFYIWVWQCVEPQLLYHANHILLYPDVRLTFPMFYKGWAFFEPFAMSPAGLGEYAGAYLSQYFYYGWVGALILTGIAFLAYAGTDRLIAALGGGAVWRGLRFVMPLLLLVSYNRYTFHLFDYVVPLTALMLVLAYVLLARRWCNAVVPLVGLAVACAVAYYVAGPSAVLLAGVLCGMVELLANRRSVVCLVLTVCAGVWAILHPLEIDAAQIGQGFGKWLASEDLTFDPTATGAMTGLYLFLFFLVLVLGLRVRSGRSAQTQAQAGNPSGRGRSSRWSVGLGLVLLAVAGGAAAFGTLHRDGRRLLRVSHFARMEMWSDLLVEARQVQPDLFPVHLDTEVNRALFHTGQLLDQMFRYKQDFGTYADHGWALVPQMAQAIRYRGSIELLLQLGCRNEAEISACNALELIGPRPRTLRHLALIHMVKRQPDAARVFLTALSKDVIQGRWAQNYLRRLDDDPLLASDERINQWRAPVSPTDALIPELEEAMLLRLLAWDKNNRMAMEFLLGHYLLARKLDKLVANIGRLKDLGYERLPTHVAEAVKIYTIKTGQQPDLHGFTIDQRTAKQVEQAMQVVFELQYDREALVETLRQKFRGAYVCYFVTNLSGAAP